MADAWADGWRGPSLVQVAGGVASIVETAPPGGVDGTLDAAILPGFTDSHVHLGLIDADALVPGGIARVLDLGGDPTALSARAARSAGENASGDPALEVEYAGAFLTATGGYPSTRSWADPAAVRELASVEDAIAAVGEMHGFGAHVIKLALHDDEAVLDGDISRAVVASAHELGLPVVAHVEGRGSAARAADAGVDLLAHTPWSERLPDALVDAMATRMRWVSTLDIHGWGERTDDFEVARDNLARFHRAGGEVLYGTDLGNGPLPTGINERELLALVDAGLGADALVGSLARPRSGTRPGARPGGLISIIPTPRPRELGGLAAWLATAQAVPATEIQEMTS
ncbi:amidohydrolase [Herbiconiux sp. CPCC 203407]|uniref:Amidohydrolase n=1 Tax=Herbiconiux oxytropis TaxID=2970915 RepID=A0AA41XB67_9MICO|nr:amidohydrolase [Herbiconiux oxytropis]MCS5720669.1 amidohydrolase [Herbiconiux oxytropis]MCS5725004.1 amidohydrolase [Herbiconiux oxytropis]